MLRKAIARAIIATVLGLLVEVQCERPSIARAPFTGAAMMGAAAAVDWACNVLSPDNNESAAASSSSSTGDCEPATKPA